MKTLNYEEKKWVNHCVEQALGLKLRNTKDNITYYENWLKVFETSKEWENNERQLSNIKEYEAMVRINKKLIKTIEEEITNNNKKIKELENENIKNSR